MAGDPLSGLAVSAWLVALLQSVPSGPESLVDGLSGELTPLNVGLVAGSGILSVGVVRWLVKRSASGAPEAAPTEVRTSGGTTVTSTASSSSKKASAAFTLPSFVPLSKGIRTVTHHEIHALELGFVVGVVSVWLLSVGRQEVVYTIVVAFVAGSLGYKRYSSKAFKTVRHEPWYGLMALAAGGLLGWSVFFMQPSLLKLLGV